jgi:hypothetical protein
VDLALPVAHRNHGRRLRRPQTGRRDNDAGGPERFAVGFARRGHCAIAAFELFLWLENKQCVFHNSFQFCFFPAEFPRLHIDDVR